MSNKPVLVMQTRRLGDLILAFPLLADLQVKFPGSELRVVGRPEFFKSLLPFAPNAVFFPPEHLPALVAEKYAAVINLDQYPEVCSYAARAQADLKLGPVATADGMRILGYWQLYRAALTANNRHNAFHWADLNRLDLRFPLLPSVTSKPRPKNSGRIGLFIGASEAAKRPDPPFWISLANRLGRAGLKPVLLGGKAEKDAGAVIAARTNLQHANFCGKTNLAELAVLIKNLDMVITPDTGPMHLADWLGAPVLNLSLGNVHAAETGPAASGQFVCRAAMSCIGCWQCSRGKLHCREAFNPAAVSRLALAILGTGNSDRLQQPRLEILRVYRDAHGLRQMEPLVGRHRAAYDLEQFWQAVFLWFGEIGCREIAADKTRYICEKYPALAQNMRSTFGRMLAEFSRTCRAGGILPGEFWKTQPWHSRLFAGHTQMFLQNEDYAKQAMRTALERMDRIQELFAPHF